MAVNSREILGIEGRPADRPAQTRLFNRIAQHTDLLRITGNRVAVHEYVDTPYDEHGIVDKQRLFQRILGSVASDFYWDGSYEGPHHLMWPREAYRGARTGAHRNTAMIFRSSQTLRVILPRELHDYTHKITEPPLMPTLDVMEQYNTEQAQVIRLYDTVRFHGLKDFALPHAEKEAFRFGQFHRLLEQMPDGELGLMPDKEYLASLSLHDARQTLRGLARVQGLSNATRCQTAFFSDTGDRAA